MKKRNFSLILILGISLILISFSLLIATQIRIYIGFSKTETTITEINNILPEKHPGIPESSSFHNMPVLEIDGVDYAAVIKIPAFNTTLPVADKWNSNKLFNSPARFYGSTYDNNLVIGGADYSHQFSFCDKIDIDNDIIITDMTGAQFTYTVKCVERSKNAENNWLCNKDYDLTVFCRDTYSMKYIAVRCIFTPNKQ